MAQESPAGADVLDAYRKRVAERKERRSINALDTTKGSGARADKGSVRDKCQCVVFMIEKNEHFGT